MASIDDLTPGTWTIDGSHTTVGFTARHLMITKVRGRFGAVEGSRHDRRGPPPVERAGHHRPRPPIDTGDAGRDEHLRSADFFDVENNPT